MSLPAALKSRLHLPLIAAPMFLVSTSPNMLPTQALRNASLSQTSQRPVSGAPPIARWTTASVTAVGGLLVGVLLVFA